MTAALSVFLVGMMGAGKSTIGSRLAQHLDREFLDVDRVLEARLGVDIPTVFDLEGEAGFRRRESLLLDELTRLKDRVIATGGGACMADCNRHWLSERGCVVYLRATPADLWQRLRRDRNRPLLKAADPRERIRALHDARAHQYEEVADLVIDTGRQPVDVTVGTISDWLCSTEYLEQIACKKSA